MARTFTPRVGRRVSYYTSLGRRVPAKIVATGSVNGGLRLKRISSGTAAGDATTGILRGTRGAGARANVWTPT